MDTKTYMISKVRDTLIDSHLAKEPSRDSIALVLSTVFSLIKDKTLLINHAKKKGYKKK